MKNLGMAVVVISMLLVLAGCGGDENTSNEQENSTNNTSSTQQTETPPQANEPEEPTPPSTSESSSGDVSEAQLIVAKQVIQQQGCGACHMIKTAGLDLNGQVGPDLTNEAARNRSAEWLRTQLVNPTAIPDSEVAEGFEGMQAIMPAYTQLTDEELDALIALLQSLSSNN